MKSATIIAGVLSLFMVAACIATEPISVYVEGNPSFVHDNSNLVLRYTGFENYTLVVASLFDVNADEGTPPLKQYKCSGPAGFCHIGLNDARQQDRLLSIGLNPFNELTPFGTIRRPFAVTPALNLRGNSDFEPRLPASSSDDGGAEPQVWILGEPDAVEQFGFVTVMWSGFEAFSQVEVSLEAPGHWTFYKRVGQSDSYNVFYLGPKAYPTPACIASVTGLVVAHNGEMRLSEVSAKADHVFAVTANPAAAVRQKEHNSIKGLSISVQ